MHPGGGESRTDYENESHEDILSSFKNKMLDLRIIMNWPVNSKRYSICGKNEKTHSNRKSDLRDNL